MNKFSTLDKISLIATFAYIVMLAVDTYVFDNLPNNMDVIFAVCFIFNYYWIFNKK